MDNQKIPKADNGSFCDPAAVRITPRFWPSRDRSRRQAKLLYCVFEGGDGQAYTRIARGAMFP